MLFFFIKLYKRRIYLHLNSYKYNHSYYLLTYLGARTSILVCLALNLTHTRIVLRHLVVRYLIPEILSYVPRICCCCCCWKTQDMLAVVEFGPKLVTEISIDFPVPSLFVRRMCKASFWHSER